MSKSNLVSGGTVVGSKHEPAKLYGDCELSRPESAGVYDNRGGKSTTAINVKVPILAVGLTITATVYGRLDSKSNRVRFDAALPKGITAGTDDAKDRFKAHVNGAIMTWAGRERAFSEAYKRLTEVKAARATAETVGSGPIDWQPEPAEPQPEPAEPAQDGAGTTNEPAA